MNDQLPKQSQLTLYDNTISTASGQYFCNERQFALPREGNKVSLLTCGRSAFSAIHRAMHQAQSFIWIADWQMAFDVELVRRGSPDHEGRLIQVITDIIRSRSVHIRVLLYGSVSDSAPGTYDGMVSERINAVNRKEYPGSVQVRLQYQTTGSIDFSHHQKFVVVDGHTAFVGGIDLTHGRHSTPEFDVVINPITHVLNETYSPCQPKMRGMSSEERMLVKKGFAKPYAGALPEEGCQPRMPWQDVHVQLEGPAVVDVHRNFARRWNMLTHDSTDAIGEKWLDKIGASRHLRDARASRPGGAVVQVVRSVSQNHLRMENLTAGRAGPEDLRLETSADYVRTWQDCLKLWADRPQANILNAMVNCIRSAHNYIYIESQFFISSFGHASKTSGGPSSSEEAGISNIIVPELARRIAEHIAAETIFHVYLVLPVHPEGTLDDEATWKQQWMAQQGLAHGQDSLINRIKRALKEHERPENDWNKYLTVLNMRNYGVVVQYARDPKTFDEDFDCEIGRYVVTEQIYIHSKLMIVDDAVAIIGSANINDRSLSGRGDTEIAAVIVDTEDVQYRDLGDPVFKSQTRKFSRDLRRYLWQKHFGFEIEGTTEPGPDAAEKSAYFDSMKRVELKTGRKVKGIPQHPPRFRTSPVSISEGLNAAKESHGFEDLRSVSWQMILDKPCHPDCVAAIQAIAHMNRRTYESVFTHVPRNEFKTYDQSLNASTVPYPCAYLGQWTLDATHAKARMAETVGVIPPALAGRFMKPKENQSTNMLHHSLSPSGRHDDAGRRPIQYAAETVHDIDAAIAALRAGVKGFFVLAPLDWAKELAPSKFHEASFIGISITQNGTNPEDDPLG